MTAPKKLTYLTVEEYLESEANASVRREYVDVDVLPSLKERDSG